MLASARGAPQYQERNQYLSFHRLFAKPVVVDPQRTDEIIFLSVVFMGSPRDDRGRGGVAGLMFFAVALSPRVFQDD